ncbi:MAG: M20 family metallopeptidase [Candidatus Aminicenantes bacterium]|nr:M20 family metallopeptidase [Candidatus Aminicenantes bacterium]
MKEKGAMENAEKISGLLVNLIKARSYPGIPKQEAAVVAELRSFLEDHHIQTTVAEVKDGRPNLLATVDSGRPGRHLLLCGHTDTVPPNAGSTVDFFAAVEKEGRLYGRGTADMKGALAAMAGALVELAGQKSLATGKVTVAAVIDEEMESLGAEALILSGFKADAAIVGEPTENRIAIGHKGLEWLAVEFIGRAAHGSTPEAGINAISAAAGFVRLIEEVLVPQFERRRDPVLGPPVINMGTISGGDQPSTVAAHCEIKLDRRWVTTETIEQVFADLEELLAEVRKERPGLTTRISRVPGGMATMIHGPLKIDREHPLVTASQKAFADLGLPAAQLAVFPAWTDGALLTREANIPTIIWGPGELNTAHSPEENVRLADVHLAAKLYAKATLNYTRIQ